MRALLAAAFAFGVMAIGFDQSATAQTAAAQRPAISVGDTWTFSWRNSVSTPRESQFAITITRVDGRGITGQWRNPADGTNGTYIDDGNLNLIKINRSPAFVMFQANPAMPSYQWPLSVGKKWGNNYQYWTSNGSKQYQATLTSEVVAFEKVTVPAGLFDAYKIKQKLEYTGRGKDSMRSWSGTEDRIVWYSPLVKNYVKREATDHGTYLYENTQTRELMSYKVQ